MTLTRLALTLLTAAGAALAEPSGVHEPQAVERPQPAAPQEPTPTTLPIRQARYRALVDKEDVLRAIDEEKTLVDTLKPASFDGSRSRYGRPGHIASAINIPYTALLDDSGCFLPEAELRHAFASVGENEPVLAY